MKKAPLGMIFVEVFEVTLGFKMKSDEMFPPRPLISIYLFSTNERIQRLPPDVCGSSHVTLSFKVMSPTPTPTQPRDANYDS